MKKIIQKQSQTIQEMRDFQENIILANKERDEQIEQIRKLTELFSKDGKISEKFDCASSTQSSLQLEEATMQKLKITDILSEADEQYLLENEMLGEFFTEKGFYPRVEYTINRDLGHTEDDVNLVLKALESGKDCVNFKIIYYRDSFKAGNRTFSIGNSSLSTNIEQVKAHLYLIFNFQLQLSFSKNIELSALINETTGGPMYLCREDHSLHKYVFKDVILTPKSSENGFIYEHRKVMDWNWDHVSVTWVIRILQDE